MKSIIHFEPIHPKVYQSYIAIGTQAYNQHYSHLWPNKNTAPYIKGNFTRDVLKKEETNNNTILYRILQQQQTIGILKITLESALDNYTKALCLNKIYILKEFSGQGIGKKALQFVMLRAKEMNKNIVWLRVMQQGPALNFYLKNNFKILKQAEVPFSEILKNERLMWVLMKKV